MMGWISFQALLSAVAVPYIRILLPVVGLKVTALVLLSTYIDIMFSSCAIVTVPRIPKLCPSMADATKATPGQLERDKDQVSISDHCSHLRPTGNWDRIQAPMYMMFSVVDLQFHSLVLLLTIRLICVHGYGSSYCRA
jgi:hypothetical protein